MADLPSASVTVDDEAGAFAGGTGYAIVIAPVATNADSVPRVFASTKALLAQHNYSQGASYASMHLEGTKKPILFVGVPIATAGVAGSHDGTGVTGTCNISVAADSSGYMDAVDATVTVVSGGTVGTDQITFNLSLDGGKTTKLVRLGTATSYTIPYVGIVLSFQSGGTLVAADVYTFRTTAPMWDSAGLAGARTALAAQLKLGRSWLIIGDLANSTFAGYVTTQVNAYETAHDRFVYARASVKDRSPLAKKSKPVKHMTGSPSITFAEVGATGDTITRATGSFVTDGFAAGDYITVTGSASNNVSGKITAVSATVLTLDTADLENETAATGVSITGTETLTFAEVGATGDTITRSAGSWISDGFAVGDKVTISGSASNNMTTSAGIAALSATVMTLDTDDLTAEVIGSSSVSIVKSQTMASWVSSMDSGFASIDAQKRIDLSLGRATKLCPITGWSFRRPAAWAASIREYSHDVQIPCWRKSDGPCDGWDLQDSNGTIVEYDERTDGGGLAARFTCFRTYGNGPNGAFIALSLTRATEGSLLSRTHNLAVTNVACTIAHAETENAIGQVLVLNDDGTATQASLQIIEGRVNSSLQRALLQSLAEGQRASKAVWTASKTDVLNVPGAALTGVLELELNGTIEQISTRVRVITGG